MYAWLRSAQLREALVKDMEECGQTVKTAREAVEADFS